MGLAGATLLAQEADTTPSRIAAAKSKMDEALQRVKDIVNQPVTQLPRKPYMRVAVCSPGWFPLGGDKPDFSKIDVRDTQDLRYTNYDYVTSDLNPGVVFRGSDVEFNHAMKYFYNDNSHPKKRLTEVEMLEINELCRTVGRCERLLADLQPPEPPPAFNFLDMLKSCFYGSALVLVLLLFLVFLGLRRKRPE